MEQSLSADRILLTQDSFSEWVAESQKPLIRFCRQYLGDWSEAEDAAQDAYLLAWHKRNTFRGDCSLMTWQLAIAKRCCLDRLRSRKRKPTEVAEVTNTHSTYVQSDTELSLDVQSALEKLPPSDRAILYLRVFEEYSFDDIAKILGGSAAANRKRFERAKQRFEQVYSH